MPEGELARRLTASALVVVVAACGVSGPPVVPVPVAAAGASSTPAATSGSPIPTGPTPGPSGSQPATSAPAPSHAAPGSPSPPAPTPEVTARPSRPPTPSVAPLPPPATSYLPAALPRRLLERRLDRLAERYDLPGVSVTIRWPDGREWTGTAGVADVTDDRPITAGTAFALGSVSKTYTAAVALKLVEEGRLRLEDPAARYLPKLELDRRITVRMLLDHTSGLADYFLNAAIDRPLQAKPNASWTSAQAMRYVRKPLFAPGRGWAYSNTNYLLLGLIVEAADGRPLAVQVRARFLDPLGLDETWLQVVEQPLAVTSRGHRLLGTGRQRKPATVFDGRQVMPFRSVITAAGGAGGMAATSRDAARWMEALVLGEVLRPESKALMLSDAAYTGTLGARVPYGLGVQVVELRHRTAVGHSGRLLGFRAVVRVLPAEGMTIAVLTNQSTVDPSLVAHTMLAGILPRVTDCATCNELR